jgi:hypothetical protein
MILNSLNRTKPTAPVVMRFVAPIVMLLALHSAAVSHAQTPRVEFDVACLTPVIDVGDASSDSRYREIEARLPISILLAAGNQNQLSEIVIRIESRHRQAEVVDFAPRTRLASSVVGNVEVTERGDERKHAQINLFGVAPAAPTIHGKASAGYHDERQAVWSYERLAPHEVLVASGTTDRGYGAFFKFRPSSQASLEGSHDLLLRLRVPMNWRSEIYDVTAIAYARKGKEISFDDRPVAGQETFTVVFHQAGDEAVRRLATRMAIDEETFKAVVWRGRKSIERKAFPSPLDKVGSVIGVVGPKLPENWYRHLLDASTVDTNQVPRNLPDEVRDAAMAMISSRKGYDDIRKSPLETSTRRKTPYSTSLTSGKPALSAKKLESGWRTRQPEEGKNR